MRFYKVKGKSRYGRKNRQQCKGGCGFPRWHDSGEEADYCNKLMLLKKCGEIRDYSTQVKYPLKDAHGKSCGWMMVDFEVIRADGAKEIHEYKGSLFGRLPEFRIKKALFTWNYVNVNYIVVNKKTIVI